MSRKRKGTFNTHFDFLRQWPKRKKGVTLPGFNYCGPGNDMTDLPTNQLDVSCRKHDLAYQELMDQGKNPYTNYNDADEKIIIDAKKYAYHSFKNFNYLGVLASGIVGGTFYGKKALSNLGLIRTIHSVKRNRRFVMNRRRRYGRKRKMGYRKLRINRPLTYYSWLRLQCKPRDFIVESQGSIHNPVNQKRIYTNDEWILANAVALSTAMRSTGEANIQIRVDSKNTLVLEKAIFTLEIRNLSLLPCYIIVYKAQVKPSKNPANLVQTTGIGAAVVMQTIATGWTQNMSTADEANWSLTLNATDAYIDTRMSQLAPSQSEQYRDFFRHTENKYFLEPGGTILIRRIRKKPYFWQATGDQGTQDAYWLPKLTMPTIVSVQGSLGADVSAENRTGQAQIHIGWQSYTKYRFRVQNVYPRLQVLDNNKPDNITDVQGPSAVLEQKDDMGQ